ncbi:MAG: hypothetical protein ACTSYD_03420 [Candidatus Heimdallarchaeaceae archaeon]
MKLKKLTKLFVVLLLFLSIYQLRSSFVYSASRSLDVVFTITLFDASYGDFDEDSIVDDIQCFLHIFTNSDTARTTLTILLSLTLPNGDQYSYSLFISTDYDNLTLKLLFINQAYVSGDYCINAEANLYGEGVSYAQYELIFDPPTEQIPDDDPFLTIQVV